MMWGRLFLAQLFLFTSSNFAEAHDEQGNEAPLNGMTDHRDMLQREIEMPLPLFNSHHEASSNSTVHRPRSFQYLPGCRGSHPCHSAEKRHRHIFPLGRPSAGNIGAICRHLGERVTYGPEHLPSSGYGYLHRQVAAVNQTEAGYAKCCHKLNETEKLACALTVWQDELHQFCGEEFSIKTRHYHCCKVTVDKRYDCFASEAPSPSYAHHDWQREEVVAQSQRTGSEIRMPTINFPPGEPNQHNILNICRLKKFRPRYSLKSLPKSGYSWLIRRAKIINRIESGYTKCCKRPNAWTCAQEQWKEVLNEFCEREFSVKDKHYHCCKLHGHQRHSCFREEAPYPKYDREIGTVSLQNVMEQTMRILCQTSLKLLSKKPASILVRNIQEDCCNLETMEQKVHCGVTEKRTFPARMCSVKRRTWKDQLKCCSKDAASCFDSGYLAHIQVASKNMY
ncbi:extracellular matrix protein 1-like [Heptranchias perlo]|uniref:extracellular matrix protein 1-like n=1 Tax=Heptranchias perlo TaxID=212740 RepID=UPI00355AC2B7